MRRTVRKLRFTKHVQSDDHTSDSAAKHLNHSGHHRIEKVASLHARDATSIHTSKLEGVSSFGGVSSAGPKIERLEDALDFMHEHSLLFAQQYHVGTHVQRRAGSQSVVQQMERARDNAAFTVMVRMLAFVLS